MRRSRCQPVEVDEVVADLLPIRSRMALLSSWERESSRGSAVRLAYAIAWLRLARRHAGEYGPRARAGAGARRLVLTGRG